MPNPDGTTSINLLDLRAADVRTVIWATGVGGDFEWLPDAACGADAMPIHEAGVTLIPGLYVTGLPWLTNRGSGIIYGAGGDARRIAALVAGRSIS
jgi:putative flavoprotein involved in K+ transport